MPTPKPTPKQAPTPKGTARQGPPKKDPPFVFKDWASI